MEPCVHVITLAVDDLQRALTFYRDGLGLPTKGVVADEYEGSDTEAAGAIVIFKLAGGLILSLYPRTELAKDARIPPSPPASGEHAFRQARQPLASTHSAKPASLWRVQHWTHRPK
jgi:uncharacterized protein